MFMDATPENTNLTGHSLSLHLQCRMLVLRLDMVQFVFLLSLDTWAQVLAQLVLQLTELSVPVGHINLAEGAHSYVATATADVTDIRIRQRVIQSISLKDKSRVEAIPAWTG